VEVPRDNLTPSLDEIAEAVVRATGGGSAGVGRPAVAASGDAAEQGSPVPAGADREKRTPERTSPISASGPVHPLLEGTVIDTVLTNRLDGSGTSPVNCLVTNPVFSHTR
jgi:type IV secretory pathway VirB10-like protein